MIFQICSSVVLNPIVWLESILVLILFVSALIAPRSAAKYLGVAEHSLRSFARNRRRSVLTVALLPMLLRLALLPVHPIPSPSIHDEYANLLFADTLAHGRLANPPHPMWIHFDTFQTLQQPKYGSFRPPAPGLLLAVGQLLTGSPWFGVWLGVGLMCGAICWMLQGWYSPGWALLGGSLAAMQIGVFSYWMNTYWGGGVAALGGALMLGALGRLRRHCEWRNCLVFAVGGVLLLNTRPFEGLLLCCIAGFALIVSMLGKQRPPSSVLITQMVLPLGLCAAVSLAWMLYYNFALTGSPLIWPYALGYRTFNLAPGLLWQAPVPPHPYRHDIFRRFFTEFDWAGYLKWCQTPVLAEMSVRLIHLWAFFIRPALTIPFLLCIPWLSIERRYWPLTMAGILAIVGSLVSVWYNPHYFAPVTCVIFAILIQGFRRLRVWCPRGQPVGLALARVIPCVCGSTFLLLIMIDIVGLPLPSDHCGWSGRFLENKERSRLIEHLEKMGGAHLIFVHYASTHNVHEEWVFNRADIDRANVIWAREMAPDQDKQLISYFSLRRVWRLDADATPPRLMPYRRDGDGSHELSPKRVDAPPLVPMMHPHEVQR